MSEALAMATPTGQQVKPWFSPKEPKQCLWTTPGINVQKMRGIRSTDRVDFAMSLLSFRYQRTTNLEQQAKKALCCSSGYASRVCLCRE